MRRISVAVVSLLTVALALLSAGSSAANSGRTVVPLVGDTRIAFTHCAARCQIFTANPDGSSLQRVTHNGGGGGAYQSDWSPDGTHIAFASDETGRSEIWITNADGSHARRLTHVGRRHTAFWPAFSTDGQWVLYTDCATAECDGGIFEVRIDGTDQQAIIPNAGTSLNDGSMSSDGSKLAYQRWHFGGITSAIYTSNADGTGQRRVTPTRLLAYAPDWRPDGDRIAFASDLYGDRPFGSVYSIAPDGTDLVRVTKPPYPSTDTGPSYSPDGDRILFESTRAYPDGCCASLFIVNADGTGLAAVQLPWDAYEPSWGTAPSIP